MANDIVETVPFNFDEIYQSLVSKLGNDAPYEGSNLAQIITSMSYLISMLNVNTAANINEMMLPLAQKRENILEGARILGYESSKKSSYRYTLSLTLKNTILPVDKILIEKYAKFISGENSYYYMDESPKEIFGLAGDVITIEVKEGVLKRFSEEATLIQTIGSVLDPISGVLTPKTYIDIPFTDVEENGIELFLTYIGANGIQKVDEKWTKTSQFVIDKDTVFFKTFLRKDDIDFRTPRIYFKYAGIGSNINAGTTVKATALVSKGSLGLATAPFSTEDSVLSAAVTFTSGEVLVQGSDEESSTSIKENAPLFYNTANRVITTMDYEAFCNRDSRVKSSQIWGGDEEKPERPGEIWFTMLPKTFTRTFTPTDGNVTYNLDNPLSDLNNFIEDVDILTNTFDSDGNPINPGIFDSLQPYKIPTMKYHNRHPVFLNCEFDLSILKYNITQTRAVTHEDIFTIVDNFFKGTGLIDGAGSVEDFVEKYKSEFFLSNLIKRIDAYLSDNSGFTMTMSNSITIFDKNLTKESFDPLLPDLPLNLCNMDLFFNFGKVPEDIFDSVTGELLTARLPNINTTGFKAFNTAGDITVDWSGVTGDQRNTFFINAPILHGTDIIGKYTINNGIRKNIQINLWAQDDTSEAIDPFTQEAHVATGVYLASTLKRSDFTIPQNLNVSFFSPNFKLVKNTIPRLKRVSFL